MGNFRINKGRHCKIARKALLCPGKGSIEIGDCCLIAPYAILDAQHGSIKIADRVHINSYTCLYGFGGLAIGPNTRIASHVSVMAGDHNFKGSGPIRLQGYRKEPTIIGEDVWIGTGAKILSGSVIGKGCVIGANSVVKGTLEPYGVYAGAIAKKIGSRVP
jgi:acetyltransferase-like isoleucine patch superfamily enzyme